MRETKRLLSLLLVLVFTLSFIGCKNKEGDVTTGDKTVTPTESASKPEPTETVQKDVYPDFDMNGKTIQIAQWFEKYYDSNHTKVDDNPNVADAQIAQMQLDNLRRIEAKYNVKIDFVTKSWDGMKESINTSIAAGSPEMDIYTLDLQFGIPTVANGLALPLKDYVPEYCDVVNDKIFTKTLSTLGETYMFGAITLDSDGALMCYNADIISALGLEDPQSLYEKGEWTYEKFAEYAKAATKDLNGDGVNDQFGLSGVSGTNMGFFYSNNAIIAPEGKNELDSEKVMETLNFLNRLYNVDKSAMFFTETSNTWDENLYAWTKGNILFWGGQAWILRDGKANHGVDFTYHIVPFPRGPHGDGTMYTNMSGHWYMLPKGVKDPDKIYQVYEEFLNWFNYDTSYVLNKEIMDQYFTTEKDVDIALEVGGKKILDYAGRIGFNFGDIHNAVITGQMTVSQAVETYKPVLQNVLDSVLKQD